MRKAPSLASSKSGSSIGSKGGGKAGSIGGGGNSSQHASSLSSALPRYAELQKQREFAEASGFKLTRTEMTGSTYMRARTNARAHARGNQHAIARATAAAAVTRGPVAERRARAPLSLSPGSQLLLLAPARGRALVSTRGARTAVRSARRAQCVVCGCGTALPRVDCLSL